MVAASAEQNTNDQTNPKTRPPLFPSSDNPNPGPNLRRPKSKEVTSRYLSTSTFLSSSSNSNSSSSSSSNASVRRLPSPSPTPRVVPVTPLKRSQSVERSRRPVTPMVDWRNRNAGSGMGTPQGSVTGKGSQTSVAAKLLSSRSLSVSFQGESYSVPFSKAKVVPVPVVGVTLSSVRRGTPERRRATPTPARGSGGGEGEGEHVENARPGFEHSRWPGASVRGRSVNSLSRSMDCTIEKSGNVNGKVGGSMKVVRSLQPMIDDMRRASFDGRLGSKANNAEVMRAIQGAVDGDSVGNGSDSDSISSGSNSISNSNEFASYCNGLSRGLGNSSTPRSSSISVSARFWQETNSRMRGLMEPGSPNGSTRSMGTPRLKKAFGGDSTSCSPRNAMISRTMSSPLRGSVRPASPSKSNTSSVPSPSRGNASPSRMRIGIVTPVSSNQMINTLSILNFPADIRRGKVGDYRVVDAHLLRLLYNRNLQWRFINARADAAMLAQRLIVEKNLHSAWIITSELRDSVRLKRIKLQSLRQIVKLTSVLKGQITHLEEWIHLDKDHSCSLLGAIEALKASTLRLPVVSGARADIQNVKDAVNSAVDVMHDMASSICSLLSKVEKVNLLMAELANVTVQERVLLDQCTDTLSTIAAMQVEDSSLRTHILQLRRIRTTN